MLSCALAIARGAIGSARYRSSRMGPANPSESAIFVDGVSKAFRLPREQMHTLKERVLHPLKRLEYDQFDALRDVSFAVAPGEFFGIVGRNGSGKSTLLKCIAGIYRADGGKIYINGRMSTFIELGVGFNPDLAAYDNVLLNATMLGLTPREARRRFDQIIDFAELRDFAELKIKNYSSGMLVRLAFSVMIQVDADVLLIDEVLAVGDAAFQQKCFDEFARIRRNKTTVILVTHDMGAAERFCDRAVLLERGRIVEIGETRHVAARYLELNFSSDARAQEAARVQGDPIVAPTVAPAEESAAAQPAPELDAGPGVNPEEERLRLGDGRAEVVDCWFEDDTGERVEMVPLGSAFACAFRVRFHEGVEDPAVGIELHSSRGDIIVGVGNHREPPAGRFAAGSEATFRLSIQNVLAPDRYWATAAIAPDATALYWYDRRDRVAAIVVTGTVDGRGLAHVPFTFAVERQTDLLEAQS